MMLAALDKLTAAFRWDIVATAALNCDKKQRKRVFIK